MYVCNASTERGETENYTVEKHIQEICRYMDCDTLDVALVNNKIVSRGKKEGLLGTIRNITTDQEFIEGVRVVSRDLIDDEAPLFHDPKKLAEAVWEQMTVQQKAITR